MGERVNALILGAAGFLGTNLFDALRAHGIEAACGRRARTNVLALRSRRARLVAADIDRPAELLAAMRGRDVVFHLAGHYPRHGLDSAGSVARGTAEMRRVVDTAAEAGVGRLVVVSSTATVAPRAGGPSDEGCTWPAPPGFGAYHDTKWAMEEAALGGGHPSVVVACPSGCLGPWDLRIGTSALLVALARGMDPPHPDGTVALVDVGDVAEALVRLARHPCPPRRVLLSGGNHRLHALLVALAERYGVPRPSAPLSAAEARALADREEHAWVHARARRPLLSREIVDLVVHGVPIDASLAERVLDLRPTSLSHTLDRFDAWARAMRFIPEVPRWSLMSKPV